MILYTPLTELDIFPTSDADYTKLRSISFKGKSMYVENMTDGNYKIIQLLSTDPNDFLNKNYTPGTLISYNDSEQH
ncbi:MAG TPA: YlzJ-like family protein [Cerasibacillus sp.]|uniref:YlzJ-like family protein n=1 Tax=Cerasibacillus sp. TaxID=2498711 RepID=UPI002F407ED4